MHTKTKHIIFCLKASSAIALLYGITTQIADAAVLTNALNANAAVENGAGLSLINAATLFPTNFTAGDSFYFSSNNSLSTSGEVTIASIDMVNTAAGPFNITHNTILGSIKTNANKLALTVANDTSLTLTGSAGIGANNIQINQNDYSGLGDITLGSDSLLKLLPSVVNININPTSTTQITFTDGSSGLALSAIDKAQRTFTLQNNLDPGDDGAGIVILDSSDNNDLINPEYKSPIILTANGVKTLGTNAHHIAQIVINTELESTITSAVDITNVNELNVTENAKGKIQTTSLALVPDIKIGAGSTLTFDAQGGNVGLLNGQTISFEDNESLLVLTNSGANDRIITLKNTLEPGGGVNLVGNLEINSNGTNSLSVTGGSIGVDANSKLNSLAISGNRSSIISSPIFAQTILIPNTNQVTLTNQITANNIIFQNDGIVNLESNVFTGTILTENKNQGTININSANLALGAIGDQNESVKQVNFEQSASVGNIFATNISVLGNETATFRAFSSFSEMQLFNGAVATFQGTVVAGSVISGDLFNTHGTINFIGNPQVNLNNNIVVEDIHFTGSNINIETNNLQLEGSTTITNSTINIGINNFVVSDVVNFVGNNTINTTVIDNAGDVGSLVAGAGSNLTTQPGSNLKIVVNNTAVGPINGQRIVVIKANGGNTNNLDLDKITPVAINGLSQWTIEKDIDGNIVLTNRAQVANVLAHDREDQGISPEILSDDFSEMLQDAMPGTEAFGYEKELANMDEQTQIASAERIENSVPSTQISSTTLSSVVNNIASRISIFTSNGGASAFTAPSINTNNAKDLAGNNSISGIAAGDNDDRYGVWLSPIYSSSIQKTMGSAAGYRVLSVGGTIGLDSKVREDIVIGAAFSYVNSDAKFKDFKSGDKTKMQSLLVSLYGIKQLPHNFFMQAVVTAARTKVNGKELRITDIGTQTAKSKYNTNSFGTQIIGGYNYYFRDRYIITPMAGFDYQRINGNSYLETGTTNQNLSIKRKAFDEIDFVAGLRISSSSFSLKNIDLIAEIHGFLRYDLTNRAAKVVSGLDSGTGKTVEKSSKSTRTHGTIGASISANRGMVDYGVGYDLNLAKKFTGQQGSLKIRVSF